VTGTVYLLLLAEILIHTVIVWSVDRGFRTLVGRDFLEHNAAGEIGMGLTQNSQMSFCIAPTPKSSYYGRLSVSDRMDDAPRIKLISVGHECFSDYLR
jgi:hypothetical protein